MTYRFVRVLTRSITLPAVNVLISANADANANTNDNNNGTGNTRANDGNNDYDNADAKVSLPAGVARPVSVA